MIDNRTPSRWNRRTGHYFIVGVLALLVLSVYWRSGNHAFTGYDDDIYVLLNPQVLKGITWEGLHWAFTTFHASNWHPLTWLSHMLDVELFGVSAGWHHRASVFFHLLNTELLFLTLFRMTGAVWQSTFVAALFGVHPLNVESVAWVAERKNVLSTMFWILSLGAYHRYVRFPSAKRYIAVMVLFALGLMCKPMLVTLPFVLLLLDYWPLQRFGRDPVSLSVVSRLAREKVPLLALSVASCIVTYFSQARGIMLFSVGDFPVSLRISNAVVSYAMYLWKIIYPASLAVFYPHPGTVHSVIPVWKVLLSSVLLGGLSIGILRNVRGSPHLSVGWFWYLGTLIPVIGLVQVGAQAYADRYAYVSLIGIFMLIAWEIPSLLGGWRFRGLAIGASACVVAIVLSSVASRQVSYWKDNLSLFGRALAVTENNWLAWHNLGTDYRNLGQYQSAIACYREALRIKPDYAMAWYNLGLTLSDLGQAEQAAAHYERAVAIWPRYKEAWLNLGVAYRELGRTQDAIAKYTEALRIAPHYVEAWYNLGLAFESGGQLDRAAECFREAVRIDPDFYPARTEFDKVRGIPDGRKE